MNEIEVYIEGVGKLTFPAGTSEAVINSVVQRETQSANQALQHSGTFADPNFQQQGFSSPFSIEDQRYEGDPEQEISYFDGLTKGITNSIRNMDRHFTNFVGGSQNAPMYPGGKHIEGYSSKPRPSLNERNQNLDHYYAHREMQGHKPSALTEFAGEVIGATPAMMFAGMNPYAIGAAGSFAASDADTGLDLGIDMATGAVLNKVGDKVLDVGGEVLSPHLQRGFKKLEEMGVKTTVGQRLGGAYKRFEDALESIPIVGASVRNRRNEALMDWEKGIYNQVLAPIKKRLPKEMTDIDGETYEWVSKQISDGYDEILPKVNIQADQDFFTGLSNILAMSDEAVEKKYTLKLQELIRDRVVPSFSNGRMSGNTWKVLDQKLADMGRRTAKSTDPDVILYNDGLMEIRSQLRGVMERSNAGTEVGAVVKALNRAFAKKIPVRDAVFKSNNFGIFTPQQLLTSVRQNQTKNSFTTGSPFLRDEAYAGKNLMSSLGNSGTTDRALAAGALGLGGAGAGYYADPNDSGYTGAGVGTVAGLMLPNLLYSRAGQNVGRSIFGRRSPMFQYGRDALDRVRPVIGLGVGMQAPSIIQNY